MPSPMWFCHRELVGGRRPRRCSCQRRRRMVTSATAEPRALLLWSPSRLDKEPRGAHVRCAATAVALASPLSRRGAPLTSANASVNCDGGGDARPRLDLSAYAAVGCSVLICGSTQGVPLVSKPLSCFVRAWSTMQYAIVSSANAGLSMEMVHFATSLSKESFVDIEGVISLPREPFKATTLQVEIQVGKAYSINRAIPTPPINF